jgi:hypothetical protein
MEGLSKVGDIFRNHYEKVILALALLGLGAAVVILMQSSQAEQDKIQDYIGQVERRSGARVKPIDLTSLETKLKEAQTPPSLEIAGEHNLFNPVKWQRRADGAWIKNVKGTESTLDELEILRIAPLQFIISLDRFTGNGYTIAVTNEAALPPYPKTMKPFYTLNDTNKPLMILREIKGSQESPELVLELKDTGERVEISKEKPFIRTNTYEADLKWKVENRSFNRQRTNSVVPLGSDLYKIVAINPGEIVMSASNDKKYTVRAPSAP